MSHLFYGYPPKNNNNKIEKFENVFQQIQLKKQKSFFFPNTLRFHRQQRTVSIVQYHYSIFFKSGRLEKEACFVT